MKKEKYFLRTWGKTVKSHAFQIYHLIFFKVFVLSSQQVKDNVTWLLSKIFGFWYQKYKIRILTLSLKMKQVWLTKPQFIHKTGVVVFISQNWGILIVHFLIAFKTFSCFIISKEIFKQTHIHIFSIIVFSKVVLFTFVIFWDCKYPNCLRTELHLKNLLCWCNFTSHQCTVKSCLLQPLGRGKSNTYADCIRFLMLLATY